MVMAVVARTAWSEVFYPLLPFSKRILGLLMKGGTDR